MMSKQQNILNRGHA